MVLGSRSALRRKRDKPSLIRTESSRIAETANPILQEDDSVW